MKFLRILLLYHQKNMFLQIRDETGNYTLDGVSVLIV
jgi:hypothetical protein